MTLPSQISKVRKRDGRIVGFDQERITNAIHKAVVAVGMEDGKLAKKLSNQVVKILVERFAATDAIPGVEDIQDTVERVLISSDLPEVAKAYILYRHTRQRIREAKAASYGIYDPLKLSFNAIKVLQARYLQKDERGVVIETPDQMFRRVAKAVAEADSLYAGKKAVARATEEFYHLMSRLKFLPNSPTLMNAGTEMGQLSACFVLEIEDSMESIFEAVKNMALIHQSGGGTGFSFSKLRPKGDVVRSTGGIASGPVSFMSVFDRATEVIKQGGRRRGANMGILRVDHPDIYDFIMAKEKSGAFANFNLSVAVTEDFMRALRENDDYDLINPRTGKTVKKLPARRVFDLIVTMAWKSGDPGLIFLDTINKHNPTPKLGRIEATNPCGELPLLPYESCNLGSINLSKMVNEGKIDFDELERTVKVATHFLDNVIDVNRYPLPQIERMTKGNRKIGLGVMGFADMLVKLGLPYDSKQGLRTAERVMRFIQERGRETSTELAEERGVFPNWKDSVYFESETKVRNATVTTVAPTGTISTIADCSFGIEPIFALSYVRHVIDTELLEVNPLFLEIAKKGNFYSEDLMRKIGVKGSIRGIKGIPPDVQQVFRTAFDIDPEWHVRMQGAFQKYSDNAVSKTVNLPEYSTPQDVEKVYLLAYELGCKGITVFRYGSKEQVLTIGRPCPICEVSA
ncbi:MAG: vitamin B12-dependent ribonucleotide reductase [Candidatus Bathyarchaeia archaeon]